MLTSQYPTSASTFVCPPASELRRTSALSSAVSAPEGRPELSVVIPVYNSAATAEELCRRLESTLSAMGISFEVVLVNDGSRDRSAEVYGALAKSHPNFRLVKLVRNFGQHQAITAGMALARGNWIVLMDDDLQNPPEEIPKLYAKAREGFDVVYGARAVRGDSWLRCKLSGFAQRLLCGLFGTQPKDAVSSFRILSRRVADEYLKLREQHTYVAALISWMGFPDASVPVRHEPRKEGRSNYSYLKLWRLWLNICFGFSDRPLQAAMWAGCLFSLLAFVLFVRTIIVYFIANQPLMGYASLFAGQMLFSGIMLLVLGVIGEYLARIYNEVRGRPTYIVDRQGSVPPLDAAPAEKPHE
jgi:dolichol-phosphate mannosyltransferase